ncbi:hypothetical protein N431DRAFT_560667, partial [Stipitochalara longipes BDJ]
MGYGSTWAKSDYHFVPYSHFLHPIESARNTFTGEQHAELRDLLGGLYTVPPDLRFKLFFQACELPKQNWDFAIKAASKFLGAMKILNEVGGSFTIRDFDDGDLDIPLCATQRFVLYGCVKGRDKGSILKTTAEEAEEYFLNIPPIPRMKRGTAPWRRLIIFEGLARVKEDSPELACFQQMGDFDDLLSMRMHLDNKRRTSADLDHISSRHIFHINWFDLEALDQLHLKQKIARKQGRLYGSTDKMIRAASFTTEAIGPLGLLRRRREYVKINEVDSMHWTIVIFTPIRYDKNAIPIVNTGNLMIGTLYITQLSAIQIGLSCAVQAWIRIGNHLDALLGGEDIFLQPAEHDKFCFYDHTDLSQSKKCFWIINSVDKFHQSIQDTIYQWEWFYRTHIEDVERQRLKTDEKGEYTKLTKLRGDIEDSHRKLKAQSERFLSIQKQARELRDGLFGASNLINATESVKEAKNSAQLGETVKLLTLVTIFFLPLGYITSLWAIVAAPDLKIFAAVSVGTAMVTYLVV